MMKFTYGILLVFFIIANFFPKNNTIYSNNDTIPDSQIDFKIKMEILWGDYAILTRDIIKHSIDEIGSVSAPVKKLRRTQRDIAEAMKPYYGPESAEKFSITLNSGVDRTLEFLKAIKSNDIKDLETAKQKWFKYGDDIVAYLAGVNPYLPNNELTQVMRGILYSTIDQALSRLKKDPPSDMSAYEKMHTQTLLIADMIAGGIIQQFPEKFIQ